MHEVWSHWEVCENAVYHSNTENSADIDCVTVYCMSESDACSLLHYMPKKNFPSGTIKFIIIIVIIERHIGNVAEVAISK